MNWGLLALLAVTMLWLAMTHVGRQTWSVLKVGMATVPQRLGSSTIVAVGIAGVVGVFVAILAIGAGFERTLQQTGSDDTVIVLSAGAQQETMSSIEHQTVAIISQSPYILKTSAGQALLSPEQLIITALTRKNTGLDASISMRGVGEQVWKLWPHIRMTAGRPFKRGLRELVVGKGAQEQFSGLDIGSTVTFDSQSWTIVGIFDSGDLHNSELWGDTDIVGSSYSRGGRAASLTVRLTSVAAVDAFKADIANDPRLNVDVVTTRQFYSRQTESFGPMIGLVGAIIGTIMAVGAVFGALNATYTTVATRTREIATLRALGFSNLAVLVSILFETMLLAALGGAVGALLAWALFDGFIASTVGANSSQIVFAFDVSPALLWNGLLWALAIGLIGGFFPALRAARIPVATGLRKL